MKSIKDFNDTDYREYIKNHPAPKPSKAQMAWSDLEIGMFVHFGINTFHDLEWSDGSLDPKTFNPEKLDCDQWVRVAKDLGANYIILTAKHHDGFCLWPTETTDYSVASASWKQGKGDVVRSFLTACKKAGMKAGLYLSPWDRHEPCYENKEEYDRFYTRQLVELLTWYDHKYVELWFDGAGSEGREYDWKKIIGACKKYQPQAVIFNMGEPTIRWCGNESGIAPYPLWNIVHISKYNGIKNDKSEYIWLPVECDVPIRYHTWFYNTKNEFAVAPPEEIIKFYLFSVGRGANLLLNLAPDRRGLIPDADANAAKEFGLMRNRLFSEPLATVSGVGNRFEIMLDNTRPVNYIVIREDLRYGQNVCSYNIDVRDGSRDWFRLISGQTIGHKKIDFFKTVDVKKIRLEITDYFNEPHVQEFSLYYSPEFEEIRHYIEDI
ncbi:MAG: alpha-L-fucosidase [Promethearchaeota archaeon]